MQDILILMVWVSGLAANHLCVTLNPRYLGKAMQDHQALKTIKYILRTKYFFKDRKPIVQISGGQEHEIGSM